MQDFIKIALGYGQDGERPEIKNAELLFKLSAMHDVAHIVGRGMELSTGFPEGEIGAKFQNEMFKAVYRYEMIRAELESVRAVLEEAKIKFIPLKGSVIRELYPEPWLRNSCDIDIYVHPETVEQALNVLVEKLGYTVDGKCAHDYSVYSPNKKVHIELHYNLIEDNILPNTNTVIDRVWDESVPVRDGAFEHKMQDEMFYFYHIVHAAKHIKHGGCGVRPIIDLFLMNKSEKYDKDSCYELLSEGGLFDFARIASMLAEDWFGDKPSDDEGVRLLERFILGGGVYGTSDNRVAVERARKYSKFQYFMKRVFMSYDDMIFLYPSVKGRKYLMPIYTVRRWFGVVFSGRGKNALHELKTSSTVSNEEMNTIGEMFDRIGL